MLVNKLRSSARYVNNISKRAKIFNRTSFAQFSASTENTEDPPPGKSPHFMITVNNEDFRVETAILNKMTAAEPRSVRMMTIVGAGDTTLTSLMHQSVHSITAVDMSPNQLHLLNLKLAVATSDLTTGQAMGFLVRGENGRSILDKHLAPHMPEESVEFFKNEALQDIVHGPLRKDNDNVFNTLLRKYLESTYGLYLSQFHTMKSEERARIFEVCGSDSDIEAFGKLLVPTFKAAPWFQSMPEDMQEYLIEIIISAGGINLRGVRNILMDMDVGVFPNNEFHTDVLLTGEVQTLPPWLTNGGRDILRTKGHDFMKTVCARIEDLDFQDEKFDFITLSNCYDFVSEENAAKSIKDLTTKCLKPNGQVLIRKGAGGADAVLQQAGGIVATDADLHLHDLTQLFYRHKSSVASATFL